MTSDENHQIVKQKHLPPVGFLLPDSVKAVPIWTTVDGYVHEIKLVCLVCPLGQKHVCADLLEGSNEALICIAKACSRSLLLSAGSRAFAKGLQFTARIPEFGAKSESLYRSDLIKEVLGCFANALGKHSRSFQSY